MTSVHVDDQERALRFYTDILGFDVKVDIPVGDFRWLTVVDPDDPDGTQLLLEPDQHPAARAYVAALRADGIPAAQFEVSDIQQVQVSGLHDCHYLETLDDWQLRQQQGALRFSGETDRIYLGLPDCLYLDDPLWQRRLCLESQGSRSAILWNPWQDKAQRLSQFPAQAWQQMLCIETANVWDDCLHLAPGAQHSLQLRLSSQALPAR